MDNRDKITDIDLLKAEWNRALEQKTGAAEFTDEQYLSSIIRQKMHQQSFATLNRLQRNLLAEIIVTIPFIAVLYVILQNTNRNFPPMVWAGLILLTLGYHVFMYWQIKNGKPIQEGNLLETLQARLRELKVLINAYNFTAVLGAVIIFIASSLNNIHIYNKFFGILDASVANAKLYAIIAQIIAGAFAGLGAYIAIKWYVNRLYGRHYVDLKKCVEELKGA